MVHGETGDLGHSAPLDSKAMAVEATIIPPERDKLSPAVVVNAPPLILVF